jgi:hypothetical protein
MPSKQRHCGQLSSIRRVARPHLENCMHAIAGQDYTNVLTCTAM